MYQKDLAAYNKAYLEYSQELICVLEEYAIPLDRYPTGLLQAKCQLANIHKVGPRETLLRRLRDHAKGVDVLQFNPHGITTLKGAETYASRFADHQVVRLYRPELGERAGILNIPHNIIRNHILPWVGVIIHKTGEERGRVWFRSGDPEKLLALLRSCKYLYDDALYTLKQLAVRAFGTDNATPMALSCLLTLSKRMNYRALSEHRKWLQKQFFWNKSFWQNNIALRYAIWSPLSWADAHAPITADLGCNYTVIVRTIETYGSIEGLAEEREKRKNTAILKAKEKALVLQEAPSRVALLNKELEKVGLPSLYTVKDDGVVKPTPFESFLFPGRKLSYSSSACETYVYNHVPRTPRTAVTNMTPVSYTHLTLPTKA